MIALRTLLFADRRTSRQAAGAALLAALLLGGTAVLQAAETVTDGAHGGSQTAGRGEGDAGGAMPAGDQGAGGQAHGVAGVGREVGRKPDGEAPPDRTPVISPDDSDIGDLVMDGPSEPAAPEASWETLDRNGMSFAPPAAPAADSPAAAMRGPRAASGQPQAVPATTTSPVVVELFTSQGCSSCPPADALLAEMTSRPDVLALAYHVDYWDYLGWADPFARPEFTARQQAYGRRTGERAIYTPQFIVGGLDTPLDLGPASLEMLVDAHHDEGSPVRLTVTREDGRIRVDLAPDTAMTGDSSVDLVRFVPRREVEIAAGENRGRTVTYRNVVVSIERLAVWDGLAPLRLTVVPRGGGKEALPDDTRHAVLVQQIAAPSSPGQIIAAVPFD